MPREKRSIPWLKVRDGTYYVYWYDAAANRTKRISLATKESLEAQSRYAGFLQGGHEIFGSGRDAGRLGVSTALDQYLREHVAEKVVARRRAEGIAELLKQWFKNTPLEDVDIPASRAYAEARRTGKLAQPKQEGRPIALSTVRRELIVLKAAANHAVRWKRISVNRLSVELPREADARTSFLTKPELARAIDAATGRLKDFILVTYYTGARRRSVETLTRFQVDLPGGTINLTSPTESANERRSKKRRPRVPIDPKIRPIIERLYDASVKANCEWLWGDNRNMSIVFKNHMERIGLPDKGFAHILRHSRATHLLQDGVPIHAVSKLLGDSIVTVDRVYGHSDPTTLAEALSMAK